MNFLIKKSKVEIISSTNKSYKYKNLIQIKEKFNKYFQKKNLIFFICNNDEFSIIFYIICLECKQSILPLSSNITNKSLNELINRFKPDFIFSKTTNYKNENYKKVYKFGKYILSENQKKNKSKINKNLALLLSTSGSSGNSKFVKLSYKNIYSNAIAIKKYLNLITTN